MRFSKEKKCRAYKIPGSVTTDRETVILLRFNVRKKRKKNHPPYVYVRNSFRDP